MTINRHTTLFFDASVLVAGACSKSGGSALVLEACRVGGFTAQATFLIVLEAFRALETDFPRSAMGRFRDYLADINWAMLSVPAEEDLLQYASLIHSKDVHVLAAAVEGDSEFLLTLDRRHILAAADKVEKANLPIRILTPGDFIQQYYPLHKEYSSLPTRRG
jgi:predicted nucleic acid-binding protein